MKIHSEANWFILALLVHDSLTSWLWLGISSVSTVAPKNVTSTSCNKVPGLTSQQLAFCQNKPNLIPSLSQGAVMAIEECQRVFHKERWDCSTVNAPSAFGGVFQGSKEAAFVHAITSAALVHSVSKSCSSGDLRECTCAGRRVDRRASSRIRLEWIGCNDDVNYGVWLSKTFADPVADGRQSSRKKKGIIAANIHNNAAGRLAVRKLMKKQCRCHGVSQSCAIRTCRKSVPKFAAVGDYLKYKYDKAVRVAFNRRKRMLRRKEQKRLKLKATDLVYVESSPNYCDSNPEMGIRGTSGRVCNKTSSEMDSCNVLCCGKGYNTEFVREATKCSCRFIWCCLVKCDTCERIYDRHTCK